MPPNESDVYVFYQPVEAWPRTPGRPTTKLELREQMEAALKKINPDYDLLFAQPIEMRFNEMLEGTKAELAVKVFGPDYDVLEPLAGQIKGILEKTPGVAQVEFETEGRTPQLQLNVKRDVLRRHGLQAGEVNRAVRAALGGEAVGTIVEGNRRRDIVVRMPESLRAADAEIQKLPLRVGAAGLLPLGNVVEFATLQTVEPIQRDDGQRRAALMVNLKTRDIEGYVRAAGQTIREQVKMPEGYIVQFGGQYENLQDARAPGRCRAVRARAHFCAHLPRVRFAPAGAAGVFRNPAGDGRHWRHHQFDAADAGGAAGALRLGRKMERGQFGRPIPPHPSRFAFRLRRCGLIAHRRDRAPLAPRPAGHAAILFTAEMRFTSPVQRGFFPRRRG